MDCSCDGFATVLKMWLQAGKGWRCGEATAMSGMKGGIVVSVVEEEIQYADSNNQNKEKKNK
jgi:hypothetical protein